MVGKQETARRGPPGRREPRDDSARSQGLRAAQKAVRTQVPVKREPAADTGSEQPQQQPAAAKPAPAQTTGFSWADLVRPKTQQSAPAQDGAEKSAEAPAPATAPAPAAAAPQKRAAPAARPQSRAAMLAAFAEDSPERGASEPAEEQQQPEAEHQAEEREEVPAPAVEEVEQPASEEQQEDAGEANANWADMVEDDEGARRAQGDRKAVRGVNKGRRFEEQAQTVMLPMGFDDAKAEASRFSFGGTAQPEAAPSKTVEPAKQQPPAPQQQPQSQQPQQQQQTKAVPPPQEGAHHEVAVPPPAAPPAQALPTSAHHHQPAPSAQQPHAPPPPAAHHHQRGVPQQQQQQLPQQSYGHAPMHHAGYQQGFAEQPYPYQSGAGKQSLFGHGRQPVQRPYPQPGYHAPPGDYRAQGPRGMPQRGMHGPSPPYPQQPGQSMHDLQYSQWVNGAWYPNGLQGIGSGAQNPGQGPGHEGVGLQPAFGSSPPQQYPPQPYGSGYGQYPVSGMMQQQPHGQPSQVTQHTGGWKGGASSGGGAGFGAGYGNRQSGWLGQQR